MRYFVKKLCIMLVTLFVISLVTFWLFHIVPGDPAEMMLGTSASQEQLNNLRKELGLDRPLMVQYVDWVDGALHKDLGKSIQYGKEVTKLLKGKLSVSLILGGMALFLVILIGIPLGVFTAGRKHAFSEQLLNFVNVFPLTILIGAYSVTVLSSGMIAVGLPAQMQNLVTGIFMLAVMIFSTNSTSVGKLAERRRIRKELAR